MKFVLWLLAIAYLLEVWSRYRGYPPNQSWNAVDDDVVINPGTGFSMPGDGTGGIDMGGVLYGHSSTDD